MLRRRAIICAAGSHRLGGGSPPTIFPAAALTAADGDVRGENTENTDVPVVQRLPDVRFFGPFP